MIRSILSVLTVGGIALFLISGIVLILFTYIPWYVAGWGAIGISALIVYMALHFTERMK